MSMSDHGPTPENTDSSLASVVATPLLPSGGSSAHPEDSFFVEIQVHIDFDDRDTISVSVHNDQTIGQLKQLIRTNISDSRIVDIDLTFGGQPLHDGMVISNCGIQDGARLSASIFEEITLLVDVHKGRKIEINIQNNENVGYLKGLIHTELESAVTDELMLSVHDQLLNNNTTTIRDCGLKNNQTLSAVIFSEITVNVNLQGGRTLQVNIMNDHTIAELKEIILNEVGGPTHELILSYNNQTLVDDQVSLLDCGFATGTNLLAFLFAEVTINVDVGESNVEITLQDDQTIGDLKDLIRERVGSGLKHEMVLSMNGVPFDHEDVSLAECGISDGATLSSVVYEMIELHVELEDGNTIAIKVENNETIGHLKQLIRHEINEPPGSPRVAGSVDGIIVSFNGESLHDDDFTIAQCGLHDGANLKSVLPKKVKPVDVDLPAISQKFTAQIKLFLIIRNEGYQWQGEQVHTIALNASKNLTLGEIAVEVCRHRKRHDVQFYVGGSHFDTSDFGKTVTACGIFDGAQLTGVVADDSPQKKSDLQAELRLDIDLEGGRKVCVTLSKDQTVGEVKNVISKGESTSSIRILRGNEELNDDAKILDYCEKKLSGVVHKKGRSENVTSPVKVIVDTADGKRISVVADQNDTIGELKKLVRQQDSIGLTWDVATDEGHHLNVLDDDEFVLETGGAYDMLGASKLVCSNDLKLDIGCRLDFIFENGKTFSQNYKMEGQDPTICLGQIGCWLAHQMACRNPYKRPSDISFNAPPG